MKNEYKHLHIYNFSDFEIYDLYYTLMKIRLNQFQILW